MVIIIEDITKFLQSLISVCLLSSLFPILVIIFINETLLSGSISTRNALEISYDNALPLQKSRIFNFGAFCQVIKRKQK